MTYLAILLVMLVAFSLVGWPLLGSSGGGRRDQEDDTSWNDLIGQRDAAYRGIKEIEFEYSLGNLSEDDYQRLRQRYRSDAAATLRKLDAAAATGGPARAAASAARPSPSPSDGPRCPSCDKPAEAADRYCWSCGADLGRACGSCGESVGPGARFCTACGAPMGAP